MNEDQAVSALGALAHTQRLRVFRALVVAGSEGLTPSVLADQLDVARNSLSFHLKELAHAGLVTIEQQGRNLIYRADFTQMNGLLGYLTEHCCQGGARHARLRPGGRLRPLTVCAAPCWRRFRAIPPEQPEHDHVATVLFLVRCLADGA